MKLVEILARELTEWPAIDPRCHAVQSFFDSEIYFRINGKAHEICEHRFHVGLEAVDKHDASVSRAQWEAERARILLESQPQRDPVIQEITTDASVGYQLERDYEAEEVKRYEQELWDRVAERAFFRMVDLEIETSQGHTTEFIAKFSADQADAFMAERAKRLKMSK